jgi:glyoxylase-like metal-dependent hydrolase (beta-lactamase superfamily II)
MKPIVAHSRSSQSVIAAALSVLTFAGNGAVRAQETDWASVEIRSIPVSAGVYMLMGRGGNIGLSIGADGAFLIDDQFAPLTEKIRAAVGAVTPEPVRFVLNTHWHGDHTGGNENMGSAGALIVAHDNVRRRMNPADFRNLVGRSNQAPPRALPVVTFSDEINFHWNGEHLHVFHVARAHTDGDAVIVFTRANVVHMGDLFFNGRYPFIDLESGGGVQGVIDAADAVLALARPDTKIIPGHGELASPVELRAYRDMVVSVRDRVTQLRGQGMSEDQVVAASPTQAFDAAWGQNGERFVRAVYRSLESP